MILSGLISLFVLLLTLLFAYFLAVLASFFNVVIVRTAREESFVSGRSKCDRCHKQLAWHDNVPLLSYLMLGGKCRFCHKRIDATYFWTELGAFAVGLLFCFTYLLSPTLQALPIWQVMSYFLIAFVLFFTLLADIKYLIVPDFFVVLLIVLALVLQLLIGGDWLRPIMAVLASTVFFCLLYLVAKKSLGKEALGMGDIKLMIPLAFLLSWPNITLAIFLAFVIGGFFAMLVLIAKKKKFGQVLPFAPFLILASVISFLFGSVIWQWYLGLLTI